MIRTSPSPRRLCAPGDPRNPGVPRRWFARARGSLRTLDAARSLGGAVPLVVRLRSAVCLLGRFPALAGVDLDVAAGEVVLLSGRQRRGQDHAAAAARRPGPAALGRGEVLGIDLDPRPARPPPSARARRPRDLLLRRPHRRREPALRGQGQRRHRRRPRTTRSTALGLERLADVRHGKLSAGQRRRLALAIGLAREPELLLLDEPHAGLDAAGRALLDAVLKARPPTARRSCSRRTSSSSCGRSRPRGRARERPGERRVAPTHRRRSRPPYEHRAGGRARSRGRTSGSRRAPASSRSRSCPSG